MCRAARDRASRARMRANDQTMNRLLLIGVGKLRFVFNVGRPAEPTGNVGPTWAPTGNSRAAASGCSPSARDARPDLAAILVATLRVVAAVVAPGRAQARQDRCDPFAAQATHRNLLFAHRSPQRGSRGDDLG